MAGLRDILWAVAMDRRWVGCSDDLKAGHWAVRWAEWTDNHLADSKEQHWAEKWDSTRVDLWGDQSVEWKAGESAGSKVWN